MASDGTKIYQECKSIRSGTKVLSCIRFCVVTNLRNSEFLDQRSHLRPRNIHREAVDALSVTSHFSKKEISLCSMDHRQYHLGLHCCSDRVCRSTLYPVRSSLGPYGTRLLHQSGPRDTCLQLFQHRYRCRDLGPANANALEAADHNETKAATDFSFSPRWLVQLNLMSCSMSYLMQAYRVCIVSLIRITKLLEISLIDPGCKSFGYRQTRYLLTNSRDSNFRRYMVCR